MPALALQREHRRRLGVLGSVLDVIDTDVSPRLAHATKLSGCSITSVVHPLSWRAFQMTR